MSRTVSYTVVVSAEDGGFIVTAPALPGMVTDGDSIHEALENAHDAIGAWCVARARIKALPDDRGPSAIDRTVNIIQICQISVTIADW